MEILRCSQKSPPEGKGSLEPSLKLLVEFSNKPAHGLAAAPKYKGQGHATGGQASKTEVVCMSCMAL